MSSDEPDGSEGGDGQGGEGVAAEVADETWGVADELVEEAEGTVAEQVEMEALTLERFPAWEESQGEQRREVERQFGGHGGPAHDSVRVGEGVPGGRVRGAEAATLEPASEAAEGGAEGDDQGEAVAGGCGVAEPGFGPFHRRVAEEEAAEHALSGDPA